MGNTALVTGASSGIGTELARYHASKGDLVKINEKGLNFMINWVVPFMPRKTVLKVSQKAMQK